MTPEFWCGKRVLVTGHTGFKGGWLCLWLQSMGAEVHGLGLDPPTEPNLFTVARIQDGLASNAITDIRDLRNLGLVVKEIQPEIVLHMAAQSLVRYSYENPVETYDVNIMGTVNLLEAIRTTAGIKAVIVVTTDKCYENREWVWGYREDEPMGGHDPYASSKGCVELVTAAYRRSYFAGSGVGLATARAGNVIGGGDWAANRLIPDCLRAMTTGEILAIRFPEAVRPWQHVLEPLAGYLTLAERLHQNSEEFAEAWNFGPTDGDSRTVGWVVDYLASRIPGMKWQREMSNQPHEANYLKLDSSKARARLKWQPRWLLHTALDKTLEWNVAWRGQQDMRQIMRTQIEAYVGTKPGVGRGEV